MALVAWLTPCAATTLNFGTLAAGEVIDTKFADQGLVFDASGWLPYGARVPRPPATQWLFGDQTIASISCAPLCSAEFPGALVHGVFQRATHRTISVALGQYARSTSEPVPAVVTLTAYDVDGLVVGKATSASLAIRHGYSTTVEVQSTASNIASFLIESLPNGNAATFIGMSTLSFDDGAMGAPNFTLSAPGGGVVLQGNILKLPVVVHRLNGSTGPIVLSTGPMPPGLRAGFTPPVIAADEPATLTIGADDDATPAVIPSKMTVIATPSTPSVGPAPRSVEAYATVHSNYDIRRLPSSSPDPQLAAGCSDQVVSFVVRRDLAFSDPITVSIANPQQDIGLSLDTSLLTFPGGAAEQVVKLTIKALGGSSASARTITIGAKSGFSWPERTAQVVVGAVAPHATQVTPTTVQTPQMLRAGSVVQFDGSGFCPDAAVEFGNELAIAKPLFVSPDGTVLRVRVPRYATSGAARLALPGVVPAGWPLLYGAMQVQSWRNRNGYAFHNPAYIPVTFDDATELFGYDQTHLNIDFCFPFGCRVPLPIPDPLAGVFVDIADAVLDDGQCFGMALSSLRLIHGDMSPAALGSPLAQGVHDLPGSAPVLHYMHLQHLAQLGAEFAGYAWKQVALNASEPSGHIRSQIVDALTAGDHPHISLIHGANDGHTVVGYDLEEDGLGTGGFFVWIYDPNFEYQAAEDSAGDGLLHAGREGFTDANGVERGSRLHVFSNGQWLLPHKDGDQWTNGLNNLMVARYSDAPLSPTIPTSFAGLVTVIFGDAAQTTQLADAAGHVLLDPAGRLNTDPVTSLPAMRRLAPFHADDPMPAREAFVVTGDGRYTHAVMGRGTGRYRSAAFSHGVTTQLDATIARGATQSITRITGVAAMEATATPVAMMTLDVAAPAPDGVLRRATVTLPVGVDRDVLSYDPATTSFVVEHRGADASVTVTLSASGGAALPGRVTNRSVRLRHGERLQIVPADWTHLHDAVIKLVTTAVDGSLREVGWRPGASADSIRIGAMALRGRTARARVQATWSARDRDDKPLLATAFVVRQDGRLVQRGAVSARVGRSGESQSPQWTLADDLPPGRYQVEATVTLLHTSPAVDASQHRSTQTISVP